MSAAGGYFWADNEEGFSLMNFHDDEDALLILFYSGHRRSTCCLYVEVSKVKLFIILVDVIERKEDGHT